MTFDEVFAANYSDVPNIDRLTASILRTAARRSLASAWNAAIDNAAVETQAMRKAVIDHYGADLALEIRKVIDDRVAAIRALKVTE